MSDTKIDDGGCAFPSTTHTADGYSVNGPEFGMTLRDYFAAKALVGLVQNWSIPCQPCRAMDNAASTAYAMADAMLKARSL